MRFNNLQSALEKYRDLVIKEAKQELVSLKKANTGGLVDKIKKGNVKVYANSLEFNIKMPYYAAFVDKGVKGKDPSNLSPNTKKRGQQAPNSPYKFGSGKFGGTFDKFVQNMTDFAKNKNIRFRDQKGRFTEGGYKSMGYVIAKNIYNRGLAPSLFFTTPFKKYFTDVPKEITEAFGLDVANFISFIVKQNFNQDVQN
tara:strand:+ start:383 stop:976 length:594 start_codon:yes stop_codon:yes gene_type:complete